ncbi:MAG: 4-hydroxyphenylacetate 3-hydroxylase N-terminal domain-containing protein [Desulfitobacteriaceae bacterium]|nr:4-hydroxyphenylacetate 3-hydroxylase N-terminal domain-containing protein [Desulfitobacteriaceae bacterium]MDI6879142.1 4-hydroxyphenylacetate 3-hydroxylase N-terminal domain-containing protein [Desulfitobacteriaceae bacterium]MDI6913297.1 4-hydroxyphenylacetate 3-hydroxylase N-terminal domain-containing protein [Desulfitobacteriaceae bacterium]
MTLRTREDYLTALKGMRPNIYKFGERIEDVTTHPATRRVVESHARAFDAVDDPKLADIFTTRSSFDGEPIHRFNSLMTSLEDTLYNMKLKRASYRMTGTCSGGTCVGWNAANVLWAVTHDMDEEMGTAYQARLKNWLLQAQKKGLVVAGALTDAKGDRSLKPSQQPDPDSNVHVVEVREDGIVVRGAKVMIAGVAASDEIMVIPGSGYGEDDKDCAVAFVIPRDIEGLTIVEARRASDSREFEEGFDIPETGITQAYLMFENVFVPNERVFMCKEYKYTGKIIQYFTANYRACIGACVAGQGDVMIGAAMLMARTNGLSAKTFMPKLVDMALNNETTYTAGAGALALGKQHEAGVWMADSVAAHTNKVLVATLPYETKRLCQDIAGGIGETGCLPSYQDFMDPNIGPLVQKYVKGGQKVTAESRVRAARLVEWLTLGAGVPGTMHGGGSPDGAKLVVRAGTPFEDYVTYAARIAGIEEEIQDPGRK